MSSRGVVFVHSAPPALCPHVEWAVSGVLGAPARFSWSGQPAAPGTFRAELPWEGSRGTAAAIATALRGWAHLRFEVTEDAGEGGEGERYACTPGLGLHRATVGPHGDQMVHEDRIRAAVVEAAGDGARLTEQLRLLLGEPWDEELEPFRHAGDGAPVRWLHQVV